MPLSVGLAGALVMVEVFLRQLRFRAVAAGGELLGRVARVVVLWLAALAVIVSVARHTFVVEIGGDLARTIGGALGLTPEVGFHADALRTLGLGLLWLLVVLAAAFAVSRRAPLPRAALPYQQAVRPAAFAVLMVLLAYAVIGVVVGVVTALVHGNARETLAVVLLAVPNLAWVGLRPGPGGALARAPDRRDRPADAAGAGGRAADAGGRGGHREPEHPRRVRRPDLVAPGAVRGPAAGHAAS